MEVNLSGAKKCAICEICTFISNYKSGFYFFENCKKIEIPNSIPAWGTKVVHYYERLFFMNFIISGIFCLAIYNLNSPV